MNKSFIKKEKFIKLIPWILFILVSVYSIWHTLNVNNIIDKEVYTETKRAVANAGLEAGQIKSQLGVVVSSSGDLPQNNSSNNSQ